MEGTTDNIKDYLDSIFGKKRIDKLYKKATTRELVLASEEDLIYFGATPKMAKNLFLIFKIRNAPNTHQGVSIIDSESSIAIFKDLKSLQHEEFHILLLNRWNCVIRRVSHSKGGMNGTVVDVRLIALDVIRHKASAIVIGHNHPSGNHNPSRADLVITEKIVKALRLLDVQVLDHIIIASEGEAYSMAEEGDLGRM